jgi:hypothetical protein
MLSFSTSTRSCTGTSPRSHSPAPFIQAELVGVGTGLHRLRASGLGEQPQTKTGWVERDQGAAHPFPRVMAGASRRITTGGNSLRRSV